MEGASSYLDDNLLTRLPDTFVANFKELYDLWVAVTCATCTLRVRLTFANRRSDLSNNALEALPEDFLKNTDISNSL